MQPVTPEDWPKVDQAIADALDEAPELRETLIRHRLEGRADLIENALSLLSYEDQDGPNQHDKDQFGKDQRGEDPLDAPLAPDWIGRRVGAYRITAKAGEGGMGVVWSAVRDDGQFERRVAVKFLSGLSFGDRSLYDRFLVERGILARLDHPNICRLIDAGIAEDHLPYLVMEWVEGKRIDEYAREQQLSPREIVRLFRQACLAVEHAHRQLVVHRDLKPSNILVDEHGNAKLLDFGIAKMLDPARSVSQSTTPQNAVLTPDYASPEQFRGDPVSTATDVYSLGVVFYELLAGARPFDWGGKRLAEIIEEAGRATPPEPSELRKDVPHELDAITRKALDGDPGQRYGSASEFALDLENFLSGRPVLARPASRLYVARKFIGRHWLGFAGATIAVALIAGAAAVAIREKIRAERRFAQLQQLSHSVIFEFQDGISLIPGTLEMRRKMVQRSLEYLDSLAADAQDDPPLLREIANGYARLAALQGRPSVSNLGDFRGALASIRKAEATLERLLALRSGDFEAACGLGDAIWAAGEIQGRVPGEASAATFRRGIAYWEQLSDRYPGRERVMSGLAAGMFYQEDFERALRLYEQLLALDSSNPRYRRNVAMMCRYLAAKSNAAHDYPKSLDYVSRAIEGDRKRVEQKPLDRMARLDLSFDISQLVDLYQKQGQFREALPLVKQALEIRRELVRMDPGDEQAKDRLLYLLSKTGDVEAGVQDYGEAARYYRESIRLGEELTRNGSRQNVQFSESISRARDGLTTALKHAH